MAPRPVFRRSRFAGRLLEDRVIARRTFLAGTGAVLLAAPLAAEAQQAGKVRRIAYLDQGSAARKRPYFEAFRQGLRDLGWVEGQNIAINFRLRKEIAEFAIKHGLPSAAAFREYALDGILLSYGPDLIVMCRRAADYADKILKGAKPGDLPVEQPTKFELVINLKTAKALGLTIPQSLLGRADEVIQ